MDPIFARPIADFVLFVAVVWLSMQIGAFACRRLRPLRDDERGDIELVINAGLTLLALIIGFTFSMAVGRYDQRKNYEEEEANAIGTEYVRADLLPSDDGARVRKLLRLYLDQRLLFYTDRGSSRLQQIDAETARLQGEMWSTVTRVAHSAAYSRDGSRGGGDERRIEPAGIHTGRFLEPHSRRSMDTDAVYFHLLQCAHRLWGTSKGRPVVYCSACPYRDCLFSYRRHR